MFWKKVCPAFGTIAFATTELAVWLEASHYRSLGRLRATWEVLQRQDLVSGSLALKRGSYQIQCQDMGLSTNDKTGNEMVLGCKERWVKLT